jgi:general transcription factor 3C protein 4
LRVQLQKTSTDSSPFHPVSGITYRQKEDRLIITLFDGSFHVIRHMSMDPSWASRTVVDADNGHVSSEALSGLSRATFEKAEKGDVDRNDMVRIDGAIPYDDGSTFLWVYEYVFCPWCCSAWTI